MWIAHQDWKTRINSFNMPNFQTLLFLKTSSKINRLFDFTHSWAATLPVLFGGKKFSYCFLHWKIVNSFGDFQNLALIGRLKMIHWQRSNNLFVLSMDASHAIVSTLLPTVPIYHANLNPIPVTWSWNKNQIVKQISLFLQWNLEYCTQKHFMTRD